MESNLAWTWWRVEFRPKIHWIQTERGVQTHHVKSLNTRSLRFLWAYCQFHSTYFLPQKSYDIALELTTNNRSSNLSGNYNDPYNYQMILVFFFKNVLNLKKIVFNQSKCLSFIKLMVSKPTSRKTVLNSLDTYNLDPSVKSGCKDVMVHAWTKYNS